MLPINKTATSANPNRAEPVEIWKAQKFIEQHSGGKAFFDFGHPFKDQT